MSSLANAIKRKTHKERAQPGARAKFGLLEKKKDYVLRAKDFHKKEKTIKVLKRKAEEKNPDEFYFAMQSSKTKDGVHDARKSKANKYSQDELRLMKTQDIKYLTMKERTDAEKVRKMKAELHLIGVNPSERKHVVFVDSKEEAESFKPEEYFDTPAELLGRTFNRPRESQLAATHNKSLPDASGPAASARLKKLEARKQGRYKELLQREERREKLSKVSSKMEYEKQVMGKGRKRKLGKDEVQGGNEEGGDEGNQPAIFKWKRERLK